MTSLDNEIQKREMQGSGWNLQGINFLNIFFHKTNPLNGMTYVKYPIRTNSILNIQNIDTFCFPCSILANIHPVDEDLQRFNKYYPYRNELNITNIDCTNGMKIVNIPRFKILNPTVALDVFEFSTDEDNDYKLALL